MLQWNKLVKYLNILNVIDLMWMLILPQPTKTCYLEKIIYKKESVVQKSWLWDPRAYLWGEVTAHKTQGFMNLFCEDVTSVSLCHGFYHPDLSSGNNEDFPVDIAKSVL